VVQALYEERFAPLAQLQAAPGAALSSALLRCVDEGDRAQIGEPDYLRLFAMRRNPMTAGELWLRIAERVEASGARHHGLWARPADFVLTRGPLARRLLDALGPEPARPDLRAAYRALCESLASGRMFDP
jgi:hypothetical protein